MVYSDWRSPGHGMGPERMDGMILCRTFHTAPEQGQGPEHGQGRMGYVPIFQVLKLFQVVPQWNFNGFQVSTPGPRHSQCERFLYDISPSPSACPGAKHSHCDYTINTETLEAIDLSRIKPKLIQVN